MILAEDAARQANKALSRLRPNSEFVLTSLKTTSKRRKSWVFRCKLKNENWSVICKTGAKSEEGRKTLRNQMQRLKDARQNMADPRFQVPEPIWFYPNLCVLIMEDVRGEPLTKRLIETERIADFSEDFIKAGQWISSYQASTMKTVGFDPTPHVNWLLRAIHGCENGSRHIPDFESFLNLFERLQQLAGKVKGLPARRCITHRDCHLGNILFRKNGDTFGIDFENKREDDALRDIFFYFFDFVFKWPERVAETSEFNSVKTAILNGYGDTVTAPEVYNFFQAFSALNVWSNVGQLEKAEYKKIVRLERARDLAEEPWGTP
jgi:hypothetical protein